MVEVSTDPAGTVEEGGTLTVTAASTLRKVLAGEEATVTLTLSGPVEGESKRSIAIASGETMGSVELMVSNDDMVSPMGDIVITATGDGIDGAQVLVVEVTEDDTAPAETTYELSAAADSVMEGGEIELDVTASQAADADTTIDHGHGEPETSPRTPCCR